MKANSTNRTVRGVLRPDQVRGNNRGVILQLLRETPCLSRAEIARRSGLSEGTVSRITSELLKRGLISEDGPQRSTGGRPPTRLQLADEALYAAAVDIHAWESRVSLGTMGGRVLDNRYFRTPPSPEQTLERIAVEVEQLRLRRGGKLEGVGVSSPGFVNSNTGVVELGVTSAWRAIPVKDRLQARLQCPVHVEHNVRVAAQAESVFGGAETKSSRCLLYVVVDEGLGIGIVIDGEVYRGPWMAAGEFGQTIISDTEGPIGHEFPGCLEQLASNPATCARYLALRNGSAELLSGDPTEGVARICQMAAQGDEAAAAALRETSRYLGIGVANAIWGLDADVVVIDSALTEQWTLVRTTILEQFPPGAQYINFRNVILRPSALKGDARILGALSLCFSSLFAKGEHAQV